MTSELHRLLQFNGWMWFGLAGQALFSARFVVQWIASERQGRSVVPVVFWYISLLGGAVSFIYAVGIGSLPFALGQFCGLIVYARNLMLIRNGARETAS